MRVSGLKNQEVKLGALLKAAESGDFSLPVFQRDYVWTRKDVLSLADSVLRGYPIGSLLLMPTTGALQVPGVNLRTAGATLRDRGTNYVMDGQQRLTSLFKIFTNHGEYGFFFDLLALLNEAFPADGLAEKLADDKYSKLDQGTACFCKAFKSKENSKSMHRYIQCRSVLLNTYSQSVMNYLGYIVEAGVPADRKEDYQNYLLGILPQVAAYPVPIVEIADDTSLEMICHIFEKVNGSGAKLTSLDLLNAKTYSVKEGYDKGITNYITEKIKSWPDYQTNSFSSELNKFYGYDKDAGSFKELNSIIRALYMGDFIAKGVNRPKITPAKILEREARDWYDDWDRSEPLIREIFSWASSNGVFAITSPSLFEYVIGVCLGVRKAFERREFRAALLRYIYSRPIADIKFSLAETAVLLDYADYGRALVQTGVNYRRDVVEPGRKAISITRDHIARATSGKKSFHAILAIMYHQNYQSKFATDLFGETLDSTKQLHHIVPKASWTVPHEFHDSIANIVYLNAESNQHKLRDLHLRGMKARLLDHYMQKQSSVDIALDSNLIPKDVDDPVEFMNRRADLILRYVRDFFGEDDSTDAS